MWPSLYRLARPKLPYKNASLRLKLSGWPRALTNATWITKLGVVMDGNPNTLSKEVQMQATISPEPIEVALCCNRCGSANVQVEAFDLGVEPDTGYHDEGKVITCQDCGAAEIL